MRNIAIIGLTAAALWLGACGSKSASAEPAKASAKPADPASASVDHTNPASVTAAIFTAASTGDTSQLEGLCDPKGENDGDTKRVCAMTKDAPKWEEFKTYFAKGKIEGKPAIDGDRAKVKFKFGPDGTKDETMRLVKRDAKWYLSGF